MVHADTLVYFWLKITQFYMHVNVFVENFNPCHAEFVWENIRIYLHVVNTD